MSLHEWYANREIFIVGVTSELGRALLEKLLRSFPDLKIFLLIRSRDMCDRFERLEKILASPRFERLLQGEPDVIKRLVAVEGNLLYTNIGLSEKNMRALQNVSVVLHAGGPEEAVVEYCCELSNLKALILATTIFRYKDEIDDSPRYQRVPENVGLSIVRFGEIGPAYQEPMPGYVEVLNGATALMVGAGFAYGQPDLSAEITPMDFAVNVLIAAAWERATSDRIRPVEVYNVPAIGCTWGELVDKGKRANKNFSYPTFGIRGITSSARLHWIVVLMLEWLPSVLCDNLLRLCGVKPRILQEHDKVRNALGSLESISSRPWTVRRERFYQLEECLSAEERDAFPFSGEIDIESYVVCAAAAAKKYCVNQSVVRIVKIFNYLFLFAAILLVLLALFGH